MEGKIKISFGSKKRTQKGSASAWKLLEVLISAPPPRNSDLVDLKKGDGIELLFAVSWLADELSDVGGSDLVHQTLCGGGGRGAVSKHGAMAASKAPGPRCKAVTVAQREGTDYLLLIPPIGARRHSR